MQKHRYHLPLANECSRCPAPPPRVIYGYPNRRALDELGSQKVPYVLGGCVVTFRPTPFRHRCARCNRSASRCHAYRRLDSERL